MKRIVKVVISITIAGLWLFGCYKAGEWFGGTLSAWVLTDK